MTDSTPLPKSIATVSLSGTLPDKLEAAAAAGFDSVEIFEADLLSFDGTPRDVSRMASDLGIGISIFQPFRDFEGMEPAQLARNLTRAERKFDVMGELGTDLLLLCSNIQESTVNDQARAAADLSLLAERAGQRGFKIAYEALAWGRHVKFWRQAWDIIKRVDHPAFGLALDSFHTLALGDNLTGIGEVPGEKIFFMQLADAPRLTMDVLSWSRHYRNFPGQGDFDVAGFVRDALRAGYRGPLSLEIFNDEFRAGPPRPMALDALRSLIWVEAEAGHTKLPPAPVLGGFEFIEFAVDAPAAERLAAVLGTLGFELTGRHRSKAVNLYRQSEVNIVLNAEPDSSASEHFVRHGPSVCALALKVDQVAPTLARASALLSPTWAERTGPGEHRIPAVREPDGTLLYLVEPADAAAMWTQDFNLAPPAEPKPAASLNIDHIAQALTPGSMDRFVLFYRTLFGLTPEPTIEFADRFGLIRSRTMKSPNGNVRVVLNISESPATETARFVSEAAGPGVHHVAFATPDILTATQNARAAGLTALPIPANYYEDLAARFGLDDDTLAELEKRGILYDRDAHGDFRHAYTPSFSGRFFFELLERHGYQGYGASNAPIRLAAMARQRELGK
ncbi:4-hydroxyphenylpyruvate dioxygenase [Acidocella aquatica]|uniref:3-dehydroshikimate dehydratase n=1 Tax=Acidocella aquatica TaxID=1922313 RepID=A0ABQ6A468_9PROT|nr:sugar phosphate isomerase/epimerase and 4-hydroxyphenylpyruvate domain-containing protein [Acidocella aquatica]GLR66148.1 4-hydroxyphenylpyruvate dioxygenase [Acidocella aquatica]